MIALGLALLSSFTSVPGEGLRLEFDPQMRSRVVASLPDELTLGPYSSSERPRSATPWVPGMRWC